MCYGYELILDLHECDPERFNRADIDEYFWKICKAIDMVKCERYWWDDVGVPPAEQQKLAHTKGTSAVQFILTSSIVIHTLDLLEVVYVNIFSCKEFNGPRAARITADWFRGRIAKKHFIERI